MNEAAAFSEAKDTTKQIGAALATAGMGLIVYFSDEKSLEPHVVTGFVEALPQGKGAASIRLRYQAPNRAIWSTTSAPGARSAIADSIFKMRRRRPNPTRPGPAEF